MRRLRHAARAALLLAAVAAGPATGPTTPPTTGPATRPAADVAALVAQLDADDWRARDAAADQLVAKGEAVRATMVDAAAHADSPEVRARAAGVMAKLDRLALDRPTLVSLHVANADPQAVYAELGRRAGVTFECWPPGLGAARRQMGGGAGVTLGLDAQPFWVAVDAVAAASGTSLSPSGMRGDGHLAVVDGPAGPLLGGPHASSGPVTVVVQSVARVPDGVNAAGGTAAGAAVDVLVLFDPKALPVGDGGPTITVTEATDDTGRSLVPPQPVGAAMAAQAQQMQLMRRARDRRPAGSGLARDASIDLAAPSPRATRIAVLKGTLTATAAGRRESATIDDVTRVGRQVRTLGAYQLTLRRCELTDRSLSCALDVVGGGAFAAEPDVRLVDADGNPVGVNGGARSSAGGDGGWSLAVHCVSTRPVRTPVRLVWTAVTSTRTVSAPFELRNLPFYTGR